MPQRNSIRLVPRSYMTLKCVLVLSRTCLGNHVRLHWNLSHCRFKSFYAPNALPSTALLDIPRSYEERQLHSQLGKLDKCYPQCSNPLSRKTPSTIRKEFDSMSVEQLWEAETQVLVGGRLLAFREMSSRLMFVDLYQDGERIQVILNAAITCDFDLVRERLQRGDIVEVMGSVDRTKAGELSVRARSVSIVAPCLVNFPHINAPELTDEHRSRFRHLDLLSRPETIKTFHLRNQVISLLRTSLAEKGFTEVETPILASKAGGANARPFSTHLNSLDIPLRLRIAPELFLKQLIVAGFDKVFEIGKVFRNEGLDSTHNPEFTSLEMYQSFASIKDMMRLSEELFTFLAQRIDLKHCRNETIDFGSPFRTIDIVPTLEDLLHVKFNFETDLALRRQLIELLEAHTIPFDLSNRSLSYLFDRLIGKYLEPLCVQPTFLVNHPLFCSPLAACLPDRPHLSARFELFVDGKEIMNGYTELNDPQEQRQRFMAQAAERGVGNEEAQLLDEDYCKALEVGLPPTGGCGIGIDRLVMLFAGKGHIRDVILFPLNRPIPEHRQGQ